MFKRLIKKYKYIDENNIIYEHQEKINKSAKYSAIDFAQFDPAAKIRQKKKDEHRSNRSSSAGSSGLENRPGLQTKTPDPSNLSETVSANGVPGINQTNPGQTLSTETAEISESKLKTETDKAYNLGYQKGKTEGLAEANNRAEQVTRLINNVLTEFDKSSAKFFEEIEKVAIDMSVHLAEKIIGEAVTMVPDIIKTNVDKCINLLAGAGTVQIKINPTDYETIKAYLPNMNKKFDGKYTFVLEPDQNINRGGCLVEFEGSVIDGRIETQLEKIKQHMELLN